MVCRRTPLQHLGAVKQKRTDGLGHVSTLDACVARGKEKCCRSAAHRISMVGSSHRRGYLHRVPKESKSAEISCAENHTREAQHRLVSIN